MVIETKSRDKVIIGLGAVLLLTILVSGYFFRQPINAYGELSNMIHNSYLFEVSCSLLAVLIACRPSSFYYNDLGEVIIIRGGRLIIGNIIFKRNVLFEIPKRKVRRVRIKKILGRPFLALTINGRRKVHKVKKVDMGLLTSDQRRDIFNRLSEIASHQDGE